MTNGHETPRKEPELGDEAVEDLELADSGSLADTEAELTSLQEAEVQTWEDDDASQ